MKMAKDGIHGTFQHPNNSSVTVSNRCSARYCIINPPYSNMKVRKMFHKPRYPVPYVMVNGQLVNNATGEVRELVPTKSICRRA